MCIICSYIYITHTKTRYTIIFNKKITLKQIKQEIFHFVQKKYDI